MSSQNPENHPVVVQLEQMLQSYYSNNNQSEQQQQQSSSSSSSGVSASKIQGVTKHAIKNAHMYKMIVWAVERYLAKCPVNYRIYGIYTVDSICRALKKDFDSVGRKGNGSSSSSSSSSLKYKESLQARISSKLQEIFSFLVKKSSSGSNESVNSSESSNTISRTDEAKVCKLISMWQKSGIFEGTVIRDLLQKYPQFQEKEGGEQEEQEVDVEQDVNDEDSIASGGDGVAQKSSLAQGNQSDAQMSSVAPISQPHTSSDTMSLPTSSSLPLQVTTPRTQVDNPLQFDYGDEEYKPMVVTNGGPVTSVGGDGNNTQQVVLDQQGAMQNSLQTQVILQISQYLQQSIGAQQQKPQQQQQQYPQVQQQYMPQYQMQQPQQQSQNPAPMPFSLPDPDVLASLAANFNIPSPAASQQYQQQYLANNQVALEQNSYPVVGNSNQQQFENDSQFKRRKTDAYQATNYAQAPSQQYNFNQQYQQAEQQQQQTYQRRQHSITQPVDGSQKWLQRVQPFPSNPNRTMYADQAVPLDEVHVLTRTVYLGDLPSHMVDAQSIAPLVAQFNAEVITLVKSKMEAFVKFSSRQDAEYFRQYCTDNAGNQQLQIPAIIDWACGFSLREYFDKADGVSVLKISELQEKDVSKICIALGMSFLQQYWQQVYTSGRLQQNVQSGGGILSADIERAQSLGGIWLGGLVVEEPDAYINPPKSPNVDVLVLDQKLGSPQTTSTQKRSRYS
ncbi:hypothetical protein MIR68_005691 [Amoeboaphelidium protococcarum]|nr:hypothetical protein MIR68_005691 [Amoeboaphelidium protococcarum]